MLQLIPPLLAKLTGLDSRLNHLWAAQLDALEARLTTSWAETLAAQVAVIEGRLSASWAETVTAKLADLDADLATKALAQNALSTVHWSNARAGKLDQLDATVSSRMGGIKRILRGEHSFNQAFAGAESASISLGVTIDVDKSLVFPLGVTLGSSDNDAFLYRLRLTSTTVEISRNSGASAVIGWQVIEFN